MEVTGGKGFRDDDDMEIRLADILMYSGLKTAKALAGINGLNRFVQKLSVYDRDFVEDLEYDQGILYITSLPHLRNAHDAEKSLNWFKSIYESGASGLILIDEAKEVITEDIIDFCNEKCFPMIVLDNDVTYAEIIEHVSVLLYFKNIYAQSEEKLKHIVYDKLSEEEVGETLHAICPEVAEQIKILAVKGSLDSQLYERDVCRLIDEKGNCVFVPFEGKYIAIISGNSQRVVVQKTKAIASLLRSYFPNGRIGESEIFKPTEIDRGIKNGLLALHIAELKDKAYEIYDPFSVYGILLSAKNGGTLERFYERFIDLMQQGDPSGKMEYHACISAYVEFGGDYKQAGQFLHQSEGTLRYRMNRIKTILELDGDTVKFNEILSIFTAIEKILKE